METQTPLPNPTIDLPAQAYRYLIHTLLVLLPPPITDTPEAILLRNHAVPGRIASLKPVNANEAELAAQCIVARARAEDMMRLVRLHAGDIKLMMKLTAQYNAMFRSSVTALDRLRREQQTCLKRETSQEDADTDEWTCHIAANTMLQALAEETQAHAKAAPETAPASHAVESETPMRQPAHPVIDLRPATPQPGPVGGTSDIHPAGAWPGDEVISPQTRRERLDATR